ncbi:hypothetical protein K440DRAFT_382913 [Wilcoxina mikolae CBS 423.85]|nr:hypothetical protein K440DRAFT_382913 [Wilcoxina mikolae CBS 423.85]
MQTRQPQRSQPERARTEDTQGPHSRSRSPGEFTPEISPLDEFIHRGRLLKKELQYTERRAPPRNSSNQYRDPHSGRPGYAAPINEDNDFPMRSKDAPSDQRAEATPIVELRMPRFSTITNDSFGDRDSMYSNDRDSSIMGAFSFGFNAANLDPPDIQSAPKTVKQEYSEGRDSVRPTISHSQLDEDVQYAQRPQVPKPAFNPVRTSVKPMISSVDDDDYDDDISPKESYFPQDSDPRQRERRVSPGPSSRRPSEYSRAQSQPPPRNQRLPVRQASGENRRQPSPRVDPTHAGRQYVPYRNGSTSSSPTGYGPPSRQGSAESGRFPPPARTGSGHSDRLRPVRHDSRGADRRYGPPSRQNSNEAETYVPYRQGSGDSIPVRQSSMEGGRGIQRNAPSPQPPSILPMISDIRSLSPDDTTEDQQVTTRTPPSPLPSPPNPWSMERSPSSASDANSMYSVGGTRLPKPSFNFSRPLSARPSVDSQHRPSIDIPPNHSGQDYYNDTLPTPMSMSEEARDFYSDNPGPAPTYVYTKFDLPRGRTVGRESVIFQDSHPDIPTPDVEMRQQPSNIRPTTSSGPKGSNLQPPPLQRLQSAPTPNSPRLSPSPSSNRPAAPLGPPASSGGPPKSPHLHVTPAANLDPDEHLKIGIDLHEKGSLQESTYHLRCAAHAGHATGMLLYALACRHGWGMRPNQKEGVSWLKKVTELASSEVADDEKGNSNVAYMEKKGRRAQFALSIYELGVSHLNGWGTEMDKGLALNCFEIAGKWGDPDALSEAGFCYANGVGTKKDMKKAAKFYRMAEAKGVNMVGNSWIWKDKYLDDEDKAVKMKKAGGTAPTGKKEGGLFSRKKSTPS